MATKPCKDCGEPVSPTAYSCPHCERLMGNGMVNKMLSSEFTLAMLIVLIFRFLPV
jgi:hypothetical protein